MELETISHSVKHLIVNETSHRWVTEAHKLHGQEFRQIIDLDRENLHLCFHYLLSVMNEGNKPYIITNVCGFGSNKNHSYFGIVIWLLQIS